MPPRTRFTTIAQDLEKQIFRDPQFEVSSIRELTVDMGVSYATMWKAVQVLIEKGLVVSSAGKRISVVRAGAPHPTASSTDRMVDTIRRRIVGGEYQVGHRFPKVSSFAEDHDISPSTVTNALVRLTKEKLVHRRNRRWLIGPSPSRATGSGSPGDSHPTVLFITSIQEDLFNTFEVPFTSPFYQALRDQLMSRGILLTPSVKNPWAEDVLLVPTGIEQITSTIRSLGDQYRGALVMIVEPRGQKLEALLSELCRFDRPVVYFDSSDQGAYLTRKFLSTRKGYYRLHIDESAAVDLATRSLAAKGHRLVGAHAVDLVDWSQRRSTLLAGRCASCRPPIRFVTAQGAREEHWAFAQWSGGLDAFISNTRTLLARKEMADTQGVRRTPFREQLMEETASLASLLADHQPTALVCMNDSMAREYYLWMRLLGVRVPADLSLISFDNAPESILFPVSTIDFGLARLGYLAAHAFITDIPIQTDRSGSIAGQCTLVDRGSIGVPARKGRLAGLLAG